MRDLDKLEQEMYHRAFEQYLRWGEWKEPMIIPHSEELSPAQRFELYAKVWSSWIDLVGPETPEQGANRMAEWSEYYDRIRRFEEWRRSQRENQAG